MAFFTAKAEASALTEKSGASYISKSGIYDVTLKIVSVSTNDNGAMSLNFNVKDSNDNDTTFYGLQLTNNDGSDNYQAEIFNKLCVVAGIETVSDPEEQTHKLGKDGTPTTLQVLEDFTDEEVKLRVQEEYSKWNDVIRKKMVIRNFYRADGAAAIELVNDTEIGVQLAKDEKYADNVTYKDGLTADDIQAWKDAKASGDDAPKTATKATVKNKPSGSLFK